MDTNFTVGTIFGVWPGDKLTGITGRDQVRLRLPYADLHLRHAGTVQMTGLQGSCTGHQPLCTASFAAKLTWACCCQMHEAVHAGLDDAPAFFGIQTSADLLTHGPEF